MQQRSCANCLLQPHLVLNMVHYWSSQDSVFFKFHPSIHAEARTSDRGGPGLRLNQSVCHAPLGVARRREVMRWSRQRAETGGGRQPRKKSRKSNSASLCWCAGKFPLQTLTYNHMSNPLIRWPQDSQLRNNWWVVEIGVVVLMTFMVLSNTKSLS